MLEIFVKEVYRDYYVSDKKKSALAQLMAWHGFCTKPSAVPVLTQILDATWQHQVTVRIDTANSLALVPMSSAVGH